MGKKNFWMIFVIIILFLVGGSLLFYSFVIVDNVEVYEMQVMVEPVLGMNVDTDKFYFGTVFPLVGAGSIRTANYVNENDFPIELSAKFYGDISEWTYFENEGHIIQPGYGGKLYFGFSIEDEENIPEIGEYTGYVKIYFKRVFW